MIIASDRDSFISGRANQYLVDFLEHVVLCTREKELILIVQVDDVVEVVPEVMLLFVVLLELDALLLERGALDVADEAPVLRVLVC